MYHAWATLLAVDETTAAAAAHLLQLLAAPLGARGKLNGQHRLRKLMEHRVLEHVPHSRRGRRRPCVPRADVHGSPGYAGSAFINIAS